MSKLVFASVISNIEQSDIFMTVKARICEAPMANLNGARVTEAFIDEIVNSPERYVGLPLYADVKALTSGNYRRLGHLYDSKTGEFHSTQIGSFYQFEKETFEYNGINGSETGSRLVGYARIAKRNRKLSKAISELFADGALKFSFEVAVGEYTELDDDTILIDASESNYLEGTAIVTFPACEDAVALELVAQRETDDTEGGETDMTVKTNFAAAKTVAQPTPVAEDEKTKAEQIAEEKQEEVQAEATVEATEAIAEQPTETVEETAEVTTEEQPAETQTEEAGQAPAQEATEATAEKQEETASVVVHENQYEQHGMSAYDTETGTEVRQLVTVETTTTHVEPDAQIVEATDGIHIAEAPDNGGDSGETPTEPAAEPTEEAPAQDASGDTGAEAVNAANEPDAAADETVLPVEDKEKKTAEQLIAELTEVVAGLKNEIAELKEARTVVAEKKTVTAEVNPFIEPIQSQGKYSLLQKVEKRTSTSYLLLS